ncbi:hypothetical protein ACEWY4_016033 [Coilia grayii]|uniref:Securin n=1 Tax=Coilia grayii TaxID=363190 RepID=A0ABD1JQL2_9TELE
MNTVMFADQENRGLRLPAGKERQRLKSAPEFTTDKTIKIPRTPLLAPSTPLFGSCTPLQQRLALGSLKKVTQTPNVRPQREDAKPRCQEKETPKPVDDGEDIERMFSYSPDAFLRYDTGVLNLSHLPLFGVPRLSWRPQLPEIDDIILEPCNPLPCPLPLAECGAELDDFLLTLDELMVKLPPPLEDPPTP